MISKCLIASVFLLTTFFIVTNSQYDKALYVKNELLTNHHKGHRERRQTSADQMVQNILQWLQGVYTQNNRKTRQGSLREYLPPSPTNTQRPRPFETVGPSTAYTTGAPVNAYSSADTTHPSQPFNEIRPPHVSGGYPQEPQPKPPFTQEEYTSPPQTSTFRNPTTTSYSRPSPQVTTTSRGGDGGRTTAVTDAINTLQPTTSGFTESPGPTRFSENLVTSKTPLEDDDPDKHPPHIHDIDVQCGKDHMVVTLEFNREYNGIVYSKGHFNRPECQYVKENSNQLKYTFKLEMNMCGTEYINGFKTEGQSYLENVLVIQNEPGIQEVWDTIRSVRCLWEGNLKESLSVALSVGMLNQTVVTFSGDTAMATLDIQVGRGPFAQPANGLVKIGEIMTLVVTVSGDPDFDVNVRDCQAIDSEGNNAVQLTDEKGCVVKPKLFGAFQKMRAPESTGASVIAYAFFSAFKFPDVMDIMIECNVELCKTDCEMCSDPNPKYEPGRRRRRKRDVTNSTILPLDYDESVKMGKHLRVIVPEDISDIQILDRVLDNLDEVCFRTTHFVYLSSVTVSLLVASFLLSSYFWARNHKLKVKSYQ